MIKAVVVLKIDSLVPIVMIGVMGIYIVIAAINRKKKKDREN